MSLGKQYGDHPAQGAIADAKLPGKMTLIQPHAAEPV
jgi:hypothetical protein